VGTVRDLDELALVGADDTGTALRALMGLQKPDRRRAGGASSYTGAKYNDLNDDHKDLADQNDANVITYWQRSLAEAADWPEGKTDDRGRGWEGLATQAAWAFAKMAACPWSPLEEESAGAIYLDALGPIGADSACGGKWYRGIVTKAMEEPVSEPPWELNGDPRSQFLKSTGNGNTPVEVTNPAIALRWLLNETGQGGLSGMFRRGGFLVHTPQVGEDGYVEPDNALDHNGPAQVRRMGGVELSTRIDTGYALYAVTERGKFSHRLFPQEAAARALSVPDLMPNAAELRFVTHTPVVRADGSILDMPGYDVASQTLYLPDRGVALDPVPDEPSHDDVAGARKLLLDMVADFPFVTPHDRANYLGAMMTPLIRQLVPPPYKLVVIGAPQRGSGKSLLALLMRELHGGVFRSEFPREDGELAKVVTAVLDCTSAPIVQFDNVSGVLKSPVLDGLLTSGEWSGRVLGTSKDITLPNDRLWVATGNNVHLGGDLERRVLWVTINANIEHPERRVSSSFAIPDLEGWVREHRSELLRSMLILIRAWVVAGKPMDEAPTSDSFGMWAAVLRGVLEFAWIEGTFAHEDTAPERSDLDAEEWAGFLMAAHRVFGGEPWTCRELLEKTGSDFGDVGLLVDELPADIVDRMRHSQASASKSLGKWLSFRDRQWANGYSVRRSGTPNRSLKWSVEVLE
jgi:hypothetical protein